MAGQTKVGKYLKDKGDTQNDVARLLGISVQSLSNKATGRTDFKQSEIRKFAEHYGMSASEIMELFFKGE